MAKSPKFVWILVTGNDDEPGIAENFQDVYSSVSKATKGAQEIMSGYISPKNNWWESTQEKDQITWHWFYNISKKTDSGTYVKISKHEIK